LDSSKREAEQNGFDITFINADKSRSSMTYLDHCIYRGFDGVVIACVDFFDPEVEELVKSNLPVVTIDHIFNNRVAIISDNVKGMRDLVTYVYNKGHRKIAYVHGYESAVTSSRLTSFYRTMEDFGVDVPDEYVITSAYRDTEGAFNATNELLDLPNPPTCILYPDDFAAFGALSAIRQRGLNVPEDISIAGYDGIEIGKRISPVMTTLDQDTDRIGRTAASKLIDLINNPKSTLIEQVIIEGYLAEGESVRDLNP